MNGLIEARGARSEVRRKAKLAQVLLHSPPNRRQEVEELLARLSERFDMNRHLEQVD